MRTTKQKAAATTLDMAGLGGAVLSTLWILRAYGVNIPDGVGEQAAVLVMWLGAIVSRLVRKWMDRR
jgi:hypothetical protein